MKARRGRAVVIGVALAGLAAPASAGAAVTIGSNLNAFPDITFGCGSAPCTNSHIVLPDSSTAPGGVLSPIDGVVVRWRVKVDTNVTPVAFRITRPGNGAARTGAGTGPTVTPAADAISTYEVQLPIQAGDAIGIDCCVSPPGLAAFAPTADAHTALFSPRLEDGGPAKVLTGPQELELMVNADIEADCDKDGFGDETQDPKPACPRSLTLEASKNKVEEGKKVTLSGQLTETVRQACQAGQAVELQRKKPSKAGFKTVEQLQTDASGNFSTKEKVKKTFDYRAQAPETATCAGQTSNTETVKAKKPK